MAKKFLGLSIFWWILIIIIFLFVTGIVKVGFVKVSVSEGFNDVKYEDKDRKK